MLALLRLEYFCVQSQKLHQLAKFGNSGTTKTFAICVFNMIGTIHFQDGLWTSLWSLPRGSVSEVGGSKGQPEGSEGQLGGV